MPEQCEIRETCHLRENQPLDPQGHVVLVTVIQGGRSINGYQYDDAALQAIAHMLEGAHAYADHGIDGSVIRSVRDIVGFYSDATYVAPTPALPPVASMPPCTSWRPPIGSGRWCARRASSVVPNWWASPSTSSGSGSLTRPRNPGTSPTSSHSTPAISSRAPAPEALYGEYCIVCCHLALIHNLPFINLVAKKEST